MLGKAFSGEFVDPLLEVCHRHSVPAASDIPSSPAGARSRFRWLWARRSASCTCRRIATPIAATRATLCWRSPMAASVLVDLTGHDACKMLGWCPGRRLWSGDRALDRSGAGGGGQRPYGGAAERSWKYRRPASAPGLLRRRDTKGCQALNHVGLRYLDVLIAGQEMYEQAPEEADLPLSFTAEAKELLEGWVGGAPGSGLVETAHLALACSRPGRWPSLEPFVAGREKAIHDAALSALRRSARQEAEPRDRRRPVPRHPARQRRDALDRANQIRTQRARWKRDLR